MIIIVHGKSRRNKRAQDVKHKFYQLVVGLVRLRSGIVTRYITPMLVMPAIVEVRARFGMNMLRPLACCLC